MIQYYVEPSGDFLSVDDTTIKPDTFEGRAVALLNQPSSICTTTIVTGYLRHCRLVDKSIMPQPYLDMLG